jgi:hypothetical protein
VANATDQRRKEGKMTSPMTVVTFVRSVVDIRRYRAIGASASVQYIDRAVALTMPVGGPERVRLRYFRIRDCTHEELARKLKSHNLVADPQAQDEDNERNPLFAEKYPNGTHWPLGNNKWGFAAFDSLDGRLCVVVGSGNHKWEGDWWFAGREP